MKGRSRRDNHTVWFGRCVRPPTDPSVRPGGWKCAAVFSSEKISAEGGKRQHPPPHTHIHTRARVSGMTRPNRGPPSLRRARPHHPNEEECDVELSAVCVCACCGVVIHINELMNNTNVTYTETPPHTHTDHPRTPLQSRTRESCPQGGRGERDHREVRAEPVGASRGHGAH